MSGITFLKYRRSAFTLVELLVVLTVIILLAALSIPAYQAVQRASTVTRCTNNQRQITVAYLEYLADHDDTLYMRPTSGSWTKGSGPLFGAQGAVGPGHLCVLLEPYGLELAQWSRWQPINNRTRTVWYCPTTYNMEQIAGHGCTYFYQYLGQYVGATTPVKQAAVASFLSSKPFLYDNYGSHEHPGELYATATGKRVYAYLDGHVDYH